MKRDGQNIETKVLAMYNEDGEAVESCPHSKQIIYVELSVKPEAYDIMRCKNMVSQAYIKQLEKYNQNSAFSNPKSMQIAEMEENFGKVLLF